MKTDRRIVQADGPRIVALAVAFFGGLAVLGWAEGVFDRLGDSARLLGAFALVVGFAVALLDREVRGAFRPRGRLRKAPAKSPAAKPGAPSAPRTSVPGSVAGAGASAD